MVSGISWQAGGLRSVGVQYQPYSHAPSRQSHRTMRATALRSRFHANGLLHLLCDRNPGSHPVISTSDCAGLMQPTHGYGHIQHWTSRGLPNFGHGSSAITGNGGDSGEAIENVRAGGLRAVSVAAAAAAEAAQHKEDNDAAARRSTVSGGADTSVTDSKPILSAGEGEARLKRAADLLRMVHVMAPADPDDFNRALIIWKAIGDVPEALRHHLLDLVNARDITRLWETAQKRYEATASAASAALGPEYSQWDDFPLDPGEVTVFEGRAVAPLPWLVGALRMDRFRKLFFLHPDSEELMGRLDVGYGVVGAKLYPTYFRATVGSSIVPSTNEVADVQLDYLEPASLSLSKQDLPDTAWPRPKAPRWPFHQQLSDYMRAVGPGVYVGTGWRASRPGELLGRRFMSFMLVRRPGLQP